MSCRQVVGLVTEYIEGALSDADRRRFEAHIAGCPNCTEYLAEMRTTLRRDENAAILRQLLLHAEAHPTTLTAEETPYEFACECGASGCDATVRLSIPEYERSTSAIHPAHGG